MQKIGILIGAALLISMTGNTVLVIINALVATLLLSAIGIVIGGGIIAVIVNAFFGACGMLLQLLATVLGIAGAFFATWVGQQGAGVIAATLGAMVVLSIWRRLAAAQGFLDTKSLSILRGAP